MINFFGDLLKKISCLHTWKLNRQVNVHHHPEDGGGVHYYIQHFICKKCGKFKKIKLE